MITGFLLFIGLIAFVIGTKLLERSGYRRGSDHLVSFGGAFMI